MADVAASYTTINPQLLISPEEVAEGGMKSGDDDEESSDSNDDKESSDGDGEEGVFYIYFIHVLFLLTTSIIY